MMFLRALALLLALGSSALAQSGQLPSGRVWGNPGATKAIASPATFTAMFDRAFGSTGGSLIARSGAAWGLVSGTATARLPLLSGASTTPVWGAYTLPASVTSGGISCFTSTSVAASSALLTASALVLGGGAGVCPSPMASLGTTTTLLHGNAGGAPTFSAVVAADVTTNTLTNATLAQAAASTLKGNPTAGTANVQDFTITGLTSKSAPVSGDEILISDSAASNGFKKATLSALSSGLSVSIVPGGRLTLQTGTPVMTTTQSAKTTIYYSPYVSNLVPIYDGTAFTPVSFGELSVLTTDTTKNPAAIGASKVNDWFVWSDAGTLRLGHGPDWTSDTVRSAGTALVLFGGTLVNNVAITNGAPQFRGVYVGTTRSNGSSQLDWILGGSASGGTAGFLGVWNVYQRVRSVAAVVDTGTSYTYTTNTVRQARASAGNQVTFVVGLSEDAVQGSYQSRLDTAAVSGAFGYISIGVDSTTTNTSVRNFSQTVAAVSHIGSPASSLSALSAIGAHVWSANENSDGSNASTFDVDQTGTLTVTVWN